MPMLKFILAFVFTFNGLLFAHGDHGKDEIESIVSSAASKNDFINKLYSSWNFDWDSWAIILLILIYTSYLFKLQPASRKKRYLSAICFYLGALAIVVGLSSPIDALADYSFFMHMVQHMLIMTIGAQLIALADIFPGFAKGLPDFIKKNIFIPVAQNKGVRALLSIVTKPWVALFLYIFNLYLWHYPALYQITLQNELIHKLEHWLFFVTSLLFWWNVYNGGMKRVIVAYLFLAMLLENSLGSIITLQQNAIYIFPKLDLWGMSNYEHQELGGLLMWVGGNLIYMLSFGILFFRLYNRSLKPVIETN